MPTLLHAALAACLAVLAAAAAGCGAEGGPAGTGAQVLRIAYLEEPSFDPASPGELEDWDFQRALFETLVGLDDRLEPVPALAERWGSACPQLTGCEWQVLGLLAQSLTVEEVADRLGVTAWTVEERRLRALEKLAGARGHDATVLRRMLGGER